MGTTTYNSGTGVFARTNVLYNSSGTGSAQGGAGTKISFSTVPQVAIVALAEDLTIDNFSIHGADIAAAATLNLDTATGNFVHVTGTTTIAAITLTDGRQRTVVFTGALTLTNGASLVLPGGNNITTAAGDIAVFVADGTTIRCTDYCAATQPGARSLIGAGGRIRMMTITRNMTTATGSVSYTGLGFKPKAMIATGGVNGTNQGVVYCGVTDSLSGLAGSTGAYSTSGGVVSGNFVQAGDATAANGIAGQVSSWDADGFTIAWLKIGSYPSATATFYCLCFE